MVTLKSENMSYNKAEINELKEQNNYKDFKKRRTA